MEINKIKLSKKKNAILVIGNIVMWCKCLEVKGTECIQCTFQGGNKKKKN